jgi:hypothetical protein
LEGTGSSPHPRPQLNRGTMAEEIHRRPEKTHHDCNCRECNPITAMAERVDAWKTAESLLFSRAWGEGDDTIVIGPENVHAVANWLLYGPQEDD